LCFQLFAAVSINDGAAVSESAWPSRRAEGVTAAFHWQPRIIMPVMMPLALVLRRYFKLH
jgi:hypothetical protein